MGAFEVLGADEIETVLRFVPTPDRIVAAEACRGLLAARARPGAWKELDLSSLRHARLGGIERIVARLDLSRVESLTIAVSSWEALKTNDYVALCQALRDRGLPRLRYVTVHSSKFANGDRPLSEGLLPLVEACSGTVRGIDLGDLRRLRLDTMVRVVGACPGLEVLKVESFDLPWKLVLERLAAHNTKARGTGARPVLRRFHVRSTWSTVSVPFLGLGWVLAHFADHVPDIEQLSLCTVAEWPFETAATPPSLLRLRVLAIRNACFFDDAQTPETRGAANFRDV